MSNLFVTEFRAIGLDVDDRTIQIPEWPPLTSQKIDFTGTAGVIVNAVSDEAQFLAITVDAAAFIEIEPTPTAVTDGTDMAIASESTYWTSIKKGAALKVSAIART